MKKTIFLAISLSLNILFIVFFIFLKRQSNSELKSYEISAIDISDVCEDFSIKDSIIKIIETGNIDTYTELSRYYLYENENHGEFLYIALIMANKWNYSYAQLQVYWELEGVYCLTGCDDVFFKMDSPTRKLALSNFINAYNSFNDTCHLKAFIEDKKNYFVENDFIKIRKDGSLYLK